MGLGLARLGQRARPLNHAGTVDLADFAEVRRQVVDPVLTHLLRPGEVTGVELVADHDWPRDPDERWPTWLDSPFASRPGDAPKSLFLLLQASQDQRFARLGELGFFRADVATVANELAESLVDWIGGSSVGADVAFPPPVTHVDGRPRVLLEMDGDGRAELDVAGIPTAPRTLGLSPALLGDLDAWVAELGEHLEALFRALDQVQQARVNAEFAGRPPGFRVVMAPRKKAAAARKRATEALAEAPLGRWSRLVAEFEPRRDHLLERLRAELGPDFSVPTPVRIP